MAISNQELVVAALKGEDVNAIWDQEQPAIQAGAEEEEPDISSDESVSEDASEDQESAENETSDQAKQADTGSVDYVQVTGKDGQKQKLKIDFSDKEHIKKTYSMAYGARKWQAERDQARKELSELQTKHGDMEGIWKELDKAYKTGASPIDRFASLIDFLESRQGAGSQVLEDYFKRRVARENASPAQLKEWEREEAEAKRAAELERKDQELAKVREEQTKFMDEVRSKEANALVQPVFDRFSFEGKLGDSEEEALLNETMWNQVMSRLEANYPKEHSFSREELIKEFKQTRDKLDKLIKGRVEKEVTKTVNKQKAQAKSTVQKMAKQSYSGAAPKEEYDSAVKRGDFRALFSGGNFKRYFNS